MKKTLALVLALALVFSTVTVAFAEEPAAVGTDAQVCTDLGMLVGDGNGVTPAYLATNPTRIQAAVMVLRLRGLEAEAKAFTGEGNFADADKAAWAKPIMGYLKAHPELGWLGDGTNFNPTANITAKEYYKAMLEALGYKQSSATVAGGDFAWDNVVEFAAGKGLTKAAAAANFTVNDLAAATVEALKANVKDTSKTLVASLVEAGKVDAAKATAAGIYTAAAATAAKLDSAIATANDKVEVTFDADVDKAFAENAANYKIVVKGSTTALEVTAAKAVGTTMAELTTAAQTGGTAYTMTVGDVSKNFAGLAKNSGAPEIDTVNCIDTNTVELVFKKAMDRASVEDVANYTLNNGATVKAAELWIDQDDSRKTVKLTTEGVANNKIYKLKVANVKSADLVAIKTVEKSFAGITDTKAPTISGNVIVKNNQRIWVKFDDRHGVDKATAENIANWTIEGLNITKITAKDDDGASFGFDNYGYYDLVEIDTEPMTANHKYTVTVNNLADGSSAKNVIAKALTKTFYGVAVDKTAPKPGQIRVYGDNMVEVDFVESNRLDTVSATDINNYTFNEGLQVISAKILRASAPDDNTYGKTVVLTTSTMDTATTYKLTMENVADEFGNVMTKVSNRAIQRSEGQDIKAPAVTKVVWADKNTVKVYFDERLDSATANDPANYSINGDIGVVKKAVLSSKSGYTRVDLTTPDLANNKAYKLTINGVKDRLGNEVSSYVVSFTTGMAAADTDKPAIDNIVAVNKNEIRVTFDEAVKATPNTTPGTLNMTITDGTTTIHAQAVGMALPFYTIDDNKTVVFKTDAAINTTGEWTITALTGIVDYHNNSYVVNAADQPKFYGNVDNNDAPEVVAIDQVNMRKLQVTFSEPVLIPGSFPGFNTISVDKNNDQTTDALSVVTLERTTNIPDGVEMVLNFSSITDYAGTASTDTAYKYTPYLNDEDNPVIDYVEAATTTKVKVHFNEEIDAAYVGSYVIKDSEGNVVPNTNPTAAIDGDDATIVNVTFTNPSNSWKVKPGDVYTLVPKTAARDIAGNPVENLSDLKYDFVASAVVNYDYIKGVKVVDAKTLDVAFTSAYTATPGNLKVYLASDTTKTSLVSSFGANNGTATVTVNLNTPLLDGVDYTLEATGTISGTYAISGVVGDGGLEVDANEVITFSGFDNSYVVKVVYESVYATVAWNATLDGNGNPIGFDATSALDTVGTVSGTADNYVYTVEVRRAGDSAVIYSKEFTR